MAELGQCEPGDAVHHTHVGGSGDWQGQEGEDGNKQRFRYYEGVRQKSKDLSICSTIQQDLIEDGTMAFRYFCTTNISIQHHHHHAYAKNLVSFFNSRMQSPTPMRNNKNKCATENLFVDLTEKYWWFLAVTICKLNCQNSHPKDINVIWRKGTNWDILRKFKDQIEEF